MEKVSATTIRYGMKLVQDEVNNSFLINLVYFLKLSPEKADEHFDTCLALSFKVHRHYPNYWTCRKGLSMIAKTKMWGYFI